MSDEAIRMTNDDATSCKRSAVDRGYWTDPYIKMFHRSSERKAPDINRGYWARVAAIQHLLKQFLLKMNCQCQVVNLGAGFDTTFWNLCDQQLAVHRFIELDFKDVLMRKCHTIKTRKELFSKIQSEDREAVFDKTDVHSQRYHAAACDLRQIEEVEKVLLQCECDFSLPTIFISECVLVYMPFAQSNNLTNWIANKFSTAFFVNYEMVNIRDKFGDIMLENMRSRGCSLAGIDHCASIETQTQRFLRTGWQHASAIDMNTVYSRLPQADVQRIERLEFLDETEMLRQLFDHYCLCWASKDDTKKHELTTIML